MSQALPTIFFSSNYHMYDLNLDGRHAHFSVSPVIAADFCTISGK